MLHEQKIVNRRQALARLGGGFGGVALAALLGDAPAAFGETHGSPSPVQYNLLPKRPHFPGKAKAVIQLFMHGGPSHVDLYDPKPMLTKYDGKAAPKEAADDEKITGNLLKSPYQFHKHGRSG